MTDFVSKRNHKKKSMHQALSKSVIVTMFCPNMREAGSDPQGNNMYCSSEKQEDYK